MEYYEILRAVRERSPLIQCITNFVTVNDCANILLATGASPTMAQVSGKWKKLWQAQKVWSVIWEPLIWWTP